MAHALISVPGVAGLPVTLTGGKPDELIVLQAHGPRNWMDGQPADDALAHAEAVASGAQHVSRTGAAARPGGRQNAL